jgi:hypothetical protein
LKFFSRCLSNFFLGLAQRWPSFWVLAGRAALARHCPAVWEYSPALAGCGQHDGADRRNIASDFGTITALGTIGIDIWAMVAGLGLVGFALGFALKDLLSNFLAGFLILLYNPFVRGDVIAVSGNEGQVVEINMRYTVLQNNEKRILIPNSTLFQNNVIVFKRAEERIPGGDLG